LYCTQYTYSYRRRGKFKKLKETFSAEKCGAFPSFLEESTKYFGAKDAGKNWANRIPSFFSFP
jgi:hypothetical protein